MKCQLILTSMIGFFLKSVLSLTRMCSQCDIELIILQQTSNFIFTLLRCFHGWTRYFSEIFLYSFLLAGLSKYKKDLIFTCVSD